MNRRFLLPAALAAAGMAVLAGLGTWQLQRKAWKEELIARLDAQTRLAPIPLDFERVAREPAPDWEFRNVELTGTFRHAGEVHVWTPRKEGPAWTVFTPFELEGAGSRYPRTVFVARGYVPDGLKDPASRLAGQIAGPLAIVGRLRAGETPGAFTPKPDIARNQWHARDLETMRRLYAEGWVAGSGSGSFADVARSILPAYLELVGEAPPGGWPKPQLAPLNLKNDHLGYALTWFGLAGTLAGVFGAFWWRERRRPDL